MNFNITRYLAMSKQSLQSTLHSIQFCLDNLT